MKKILLSAILFMIILNLRANEKIVKITQKRDFPDRLFYLQDKNHDKKYGYYMFNIFSFDVYDNTLAPYKDKADKNLIRKMGISYSIMMTCIPWSIVGLTVGGFFLGVFTAVLVDSFYRPEQYRQEGYPANYLEDVRNASIAIISLSGIMIACGFFLVGLFAYSCVNYFKLKKQIIKILNEGTVSIMELKNIKYSFSVNLNCLENRSNNY